MLLSGTLLTPTGIVYKNTSVRVGTDMHFTTGGNGEYSFNCPTGIHSVAVLGSFGTYSNLGVISIDANTTETSVNELMVMNQNDGSLGGGGGLEPDDPIIEAIFVAADSAASSKTAAQAAEASVTASASTASAAAQAATEAEAAMSVHFLPKTQDVGQVGATLSLNVSPVNRVSMFNIELTSPSCSLTLTNLTPPVGYTWSVTLLIKQGTGANKIVWPAGISWPSGIAPVLSYQAGRVDMVSFLVTSEYTLGHSGGGWYV